MKWNSNSGGAASFLLWCKNYNKHYRIFGLQAGILKGGGTEWDGEYSSVSDTNNVGTAETVSLVIFNEQDSYAGELKCVHFPINLIHCRLYVKMVAL